MVTVGMYYDVVEGKEEEFISSFRSVFDLLKKGFPGHKETRLYRDVDNSSSFVIVSEWDSEEDFRSFVTSEEFRKVTEWGESEILSGRPRHKVYKQ
ncbi:MAG: antibiotic biosynthesis monooxygenase [Candidatus Hydrogenedentota bacterium]|nr:MAG: antibiotic biosynthesis monooxygenase [Candidatus Hydrogenedentota bacterium]